MIPALEREPDLFFHFRIAVLHNTKVMVVGLHEDVAAAEVDFIRADFSGDV